MGAASSTPALDSASFHGTSGYHVLKVHEGSPGHQAGLEAFFDFIISINGTRLEEDNDTIKELLQTNKNRTVECLVYSSKTQSSRQLRLVPSDTWGGQGLLGVSIRYCSFEGANENVWHVLDVQPKSPADVAGLVPHSDFIIGSDSVLNGKDDFYDLIESSDGQQVRLYVYNTDLDSCREVKLTPNSSWGGDGLLGCDIGYGYLHRIPINRSFHTSVSCADAPLPVKPNVEHEPSTLSSHIGQFGNFSSASKAAPAIITACMPSDIRLISPISYSSQLPPPSVVSASDAPASTPLTTIPLTTAYDIQPPVHLPPNLLPPLYTPTVNISDSQASFNAFPLPMQSGRNFHSVSMPPCTSLSQTATTAVISVPGIPSLDVPMPSLAELHIGTTSR